MENTPTNAQDAQENDLALHETVSNEGAAPTNTDEASSFEGLPESEAIVIPDSGIENVSVPINIQAKESFNVDQELFLPDAWYGSYDDSPVARNEFQAEVVIGADDRSRINPTTSYPWRAICSLIIRTRTGKTYIGTGWFNGPGTVVTAGHCLYLHNEGGWPLSIEVIPGRNATLKPYGSVVCTNFKSVLGWTRDKKRDFDYGAIILPSNRKLGSTVGFFGFGTRTDAFIRSKVLNLSGYPGDKGGSTQWFHSRAIKSLNSKVLTYEIDTAGGQSGAPVWYKDGNARWAVGIHTHGHSSGNSATRIDSSVFNNLLAWKNLGS